MSLKRMLHVTLALLFLGGLGGGLAACNTIEGVGEDISSTGRFVKDKVFTE
ncbi:MAG: entericidin A/B family lipoprotein [Rhodospirillaceae bacterium]|nr:entericidin [Rhodospirillaceae bacterium]MDE0255251.1 entericidin [Rhodospirillaceae bacterium]MDE0619293.1 entericidin [Rhodospirillaceae bacterium]MXY41830.1 entericidin A/B family lipoprotein [Rhodospirillaceae bacterium]MYF86257.1 entericidin A/B family lipoprotein [Rhodospirillaceae bacterium]